MRFFLSLISIAAMAGTLFAGDFDEVIMSARQAWPERQTVIVVCNKSSSAMALMDLGSSTEKVISLLVLDLAAAKDLDKVLGNLARKSRTEVFVLLIADDPLTGDNTVAGRMLLVRMTSRGIPVVGTTPEALKLGAVFVQGVGTGGKLITNLEVAKKLGVAVPVVPDSAQ